MEGDCWAGYREGDDHDRYMEFGSELMSAINGFKVCSLSRVCNSPLLWAHYASGFSGVAIGINFPDKHPDIFSVDYSSDTPIFHYSFDIPEDAAIQALIRKEASWSYEKEVRILSRRSLFKIDGQNSEVICGPRPPSPTRKILRLICEEHKIQFKQANVESDCIRIN